MTETVDQGPPPLLLREALSVLLYVGLPVIGHRRHSLESIAQDTIGQVPWRLCEMQDSPGPRLKSMSEMPTSLVLPYGTLWNMGHRTRLISISVTTSSTWPKQSRDLARSE